MQNRLMFALFFVIGTALMGGLVTAALSMGMADGKSIALAALAGFVLALPVSWAVARSIVKAAR